ncbi:hypothetical protein C1N51_12895 [Vibrio campbellii]|nr:hypothetical protein C1N51_00975 [Vibrio campbellii]AUW04540.1 hypothetical protein C1N51_12895 [Vibrio campbellii]
MKIIMQDEMSECGLACVAMIATHHDVSTTLPELRRHYTVDRTGLSLYDLECIFSDLDIVACSYELTYEHIGELALPAIIQWTHNHYVVLSKVTKDHIEVYDPAVGKKRYSTDLASKMFSGYAVNVEEIRNSGNKKSETSDNSIFKKAVSIKGVKSWLCLFSVMSCLIQVFALMTPKFIALSIDKVLSVNDYDLMYILAFGFLLIYVFDFLSQLLNNEVKKRVSYYISKLLSVSAYKNLSNQELKYFQSRNLSDITKRLSVISEYGRYMVSSYVTTAISLSFAVVFASLVALIDVQAFFAMLVVALIFFSTRMVYIYKLDKLYSDQTAYDNNRNEVIREKFNKIKSNKISRTEHVSVKDAIKFNNKYIKSSLQGSKIMDDGQAFYSLCNNICTIAITMLFTMNFLEGTKEVSEISEDDLYSIGNFFVLFFYKEFFFRNVSSSVESILTVFKNKSEIELASGILFEQGEILTSKVALDKSKIIESIEISNGHLSYSSFGDPVFTNLALKLCRHDKVAIVGKSGSGKTSLLNVLSSLTPLNSGSFIVNNTTLDKFGLIDYRKSLGVYFSEEEVKNKTVLKNITEDENYDEDYLYYVLDKVGLVNEINAMHSGLNTLLGQGGVQLSSGQKQRLMIAKELYKRPSVLLLDEPTSHLDTPNSLKIANVINEFDGICLVITHDNELISKIDKVYQFGDITNA